MASANFCVINAPTKADFQLQMWYHLSWSWEELSIVGSGEQVHAGSSPPLVLLGFYICPFLGHMLLLCLVNAPSSFRLPFSCHSLRTFNWTLIADENPESLRDLASLFRCFTRDQWWSLHPKAIFWDGTFLSKWLLERVLRPKELLHQTKPNLPRKQLKSIRPANICST